MLALTLLALVLSVVVATLAYRMLRNRLSPADETTRIVVAAERIPLGTRLTAQHLTTASWSRSSPLEGSFADAGEVIGRGVVMSIGPNEPVLESKLAPKEGGAGLSSTIPEGMRAVSVKVDDVVGVAGFVVPGTRVDVIVVGSPSQRSETDTSRVILENVQVLAAGQNIEQDMSGKPVRAQVVTLLVTPPDAQKLALAATDGHIQLALRNPLDFQTSNPDAVHKSTLYTGLAPVSASVPAQPAPQRTQAKGSMKATSKADSKPVAAEPPKPPEPRIFVVEVIKGDRRERSSFEVKQPQ
jgi:pilus assembly protein CpaB